MVQHARLASNNPTPVFPFFCGEHSNKSKAGTWPALNGNKTPCSDAAATDQPRKVVVKGGESRLVGC